LKARLDLPDGTEVEITVERPSLLAPDVPDEEERASLMADLVERMMRHPLPAHAPPLPLPRDWFHERG
jgi:hypothetical protein